MTPKVNYRTASPAQVAADLGASLARLRLSRNVTQRELAERAGLSERTVKRFEGGEGGSLDTLIRLLQALELAGALETLLPDPGIEPARRLEKGARERRRASTARRPSRRLPWTWDEEQTP